MEVIRKKILSWEPLEIRFVPEKPKDNWEEEIFALFQGWEKDRVKLAGHLETSQIPLEYYIANVESDGTVLVHIEWLCEESLPILEEYLQEKGTNIKTMLIGVEIKEAALHRPESLENVFITIPAKVVQLENGKTVKVDSFEISKYPVTVAQFDQFVKSTNYVTDNEKKGEERTYRSNDCLLAMTEQEKLSTAAMCVSYNDAKAFCEWAGYRLPCDAEWLASSVLDWETEYEDVEEIPDATWDKYLSQPQALKSIDPEWILEYNPSDDTAIVRYGPQYFLEIGWDKKPHKMSQPSDYTDLCLQFRVCK